MAREALQVGLCATLVAAGVALGGDARPAVVRARPGIEANAGQLDGRVLFYGNLPRATVYFTDRGPVIELRERVAVESETQDERVPLRSREQRRLEAVRSFAVGVRFVDASPGLRVEPAGEASAATRHFIRMGGAGRSSRIPVYEAVVYRGVWPGVDVVYSIEQESLTYEIRVAPGRSSRGVRFAYEGSAPIESEPGTVLLDTPLGTIVDRSAPESRPGGRLEWSSSSAARQPQALEPGSVAPALAAFDADSPSWASFLGGTRDEAIYAVALDSAMNPIVVGATRSTGFPTTLGALDTSYGGSFDAFVTAISSDGSEVLWSTYIGGTGDDRAWSVALDGAGRPVVAGVTTGSGFPTTAGAFDTTPNGQYDAFVLVLAADGSSLVWSTLYGGGDVEWDVSGVAVDAGGRVTIAGSTRSSDLPLGPLALDPALGGTRDAFVARFSADGSTLEQSTYLGGSGDDAAEDVTVGGAGGAVVVGRSQSTDFPVTPGALATTADPASQNGFASALSPDGATLVFSTYLGGSGNDEPYAVALDPAGRPVIAGKTESPDFPVGAGAYSPLLDGLEDAFLVKIAADGSALVFGTYFGGASTDRALALADAGPSGWLVSGWTCSEDLPLTPNAFSRVYGGPCEAFVALIAAEGAELGYGSYLGGYADELSFAAAVDGAGRLIVAGQTRSPDFPVTPGAYQTTHASPSYYEDAFAASLSKSAICTLIAPGPAGPQLTVGKAPDGVCPAPPDIGAAIDLVEGRLESLSSTDIGAVSQLVCSGQVASVTTVHVPQPGMGSFQVARLSDGGSYTDGAGSGLDGARVVLAGDCP